MLNSIQFSNKSNSYSMKTFKLGFGNRTVLEQISICRRVADGIAKLTAEQRATFADRPVADSVAEATEAHAAVEELKATLKAALRVRDAKVRVMRQHTTGAASGISALTGGNVAAMLGAGLGVAKEKHPVGKPDAPGNLRVAATDFEGRVRLRWKRPIRRCAFLIEMTTDPAAATGWQQVAISGNRQSCEVTGLESGVKCWFRVAATNAHGQGPWSQVVNVRVK
jgi:hypothetical protein